MSKIDVIRAWKDEVYRSSLSPAQRAALPAHPVGLMELDDAQLDVVAGGAGTNTLSTDTSMGTGGNCCNVHPK